MNKGRIKAVLFIIVFLLIVAVVCSWLTGTDKKTEPENEPTPPPVESSNVVVIDPQATQGGTSASTRPCGIRHTHACPYAHAHACPYAHTYSASRPVRREPWFRHL